MRSADSVSVPDMHPEGRAIPARLGRAMQRNPKVIASIQWTVMTLYLFLLFAPLLLPAPAPDSGIFDDLGLFSRFLLWGVGWPLIMLSMMLFGRIWCGVFCPDGTVTEFISRHGRRRSIPRWIRWSGWPFVMLAGTTVYGQLVGVYDFSPATLLLLGLPSLGALATGFLYGNGRRIWCMYLCPANGVFSLLAKIAPFHFRVDQQKWKQYPEIPPRINCAPLINIRQMKSASACHACGRCGGYMDAVDLAARAPDGEIASSCNGDATTAEAIILIFGVIGICTAAMQWAASPLFASLRSLLSGWLPGVLRQTHAPWWLLANYPHAAVSHSLLDGIVILLFILGGGFLLGLAVLAPIWLSSRLTGDASLSWQRLSFGLIPVAGTATFLALTTLSVAQLRAAGMQLLWAPWIQTVLLAAGALFSVWLGIRLLLPSLSLRRLLSLAIYMLPIALLHQIWATRFLQ